MSGRGSSERSLSNPPNKSPSPAKEREVSPSRSHSSGRSPLKRKSRSRSLSRSRKRSYKMRHRSRSRSRSSRRYRSRHSGSRSYSRDRYSYSDKRRDSFRSHSRSPMSSRRRHVGNRVSSDNPVPNRCLGVFGLSIYTTEQQLHHLMSKYGSVERVEVVIDAKTGRSRGFAFVYFDSVEDAKVAKEQCADMKIDGRQIRVDYSITQRAHTPTPGIYMGKPTYDYYGSNNGNNGYRGGGGYRDRTPSPYYRKRRYERSRSRSYSPRIEARGIQ